MRSKTRGKAKRRRMWPIVLLAIVIVTVGGYLYYTRYLAPAEATEEPALQTTTVRKGDIVITADVPLAAQIVERGAVGIDPRGHLYTEDTVGEQLASRNLMHELRSRDVVRGGPAPITEVHRHRFASALDRTLTRQTKNR